MYVLALKANVVNFKIEPFVAMSRIPCQKPIFPGSFAASRARNADWLLLFEEGATWVKLRRLHLSADRILFKLQLYVFGVALVLNAAISRGLTYLQ